MVSEFHRYLCEEEFVYLLEGVGLARIGRDIFQGEAEDFFNIAAVSHPRLIDHRAFKALKAIGLCMHLPGKTFIQT